MDKADRRWLHIVRYIKCELHQPFVKMIKSPGSLCWICPQCGNTLDELWREYQLNKLKRSK